MSEGILLITIIFALFFAVLMIIVNVEFSPKVWQVDASAIVDFDTLMTMYKSDPKKSAWKFDEYCVWYDGNRKLAMASRYDYYRYRRFVKKYRKQEDAMQNNEVLLQITKEIRTRISNTVDNENAKLRRELEHYKEIAKRIKKENR